MSTNNVEIVYSENDDHHESESSPKKKSSTKKPKVNAESFNQEFYSKHKDHWLLKALDSSGKLKVNKSGIGLNSIQPGSFWENLLNNTVDKSSYKPRTLKLMIDDEVLFSQIL